MHDHALPAITPSHTSRSLARYWPVRVALALLLILGAACGDSDDASDDAGGGPGSGDGSSEGEPAALRGITQLHNETRALVGVAPLDWDTELAKVAQAWAEKCQDNEAPSGLIDHNSGRSDDYPGYVGENIYGSSGMATPAGALQSWTAEAASYDYDSNTCSGTCGHYTQVVWAASVRLGCGLASCPGLRFGNAIVCDYSPGGNIGSQRPY